MSYSNVKANKYLHAYISIHKQSTLVNSNTKHSNICFEITVVCDCEVPGEKPPDPPLQTVASHMGPEPGSNHSGARPGD